MCSAIGPEPRSQDWSCHVFVLFLVLVCATWRSKAKGLLPPGAECRRRRCHRNCPCLSSKGSGHARSGPSDGRVSNLGCRSDATGDFVTGAARNRISRRGRGAERVAGLPTPRARPMSMKSAGSVLASPRWASAASPIKKIRDRKAARSVARKLHALDSCADSAIRPENALVGPRVSPGGGGRRSGGRRGRSPDLADPSGTATSRQGSVPQRRTRGAGCMGSGFRP